jgi:hypothetical protein
VSVPTGLPLTFAERVADACDTISTAPGSHVERAALHAAYVAARAARDPVELQHAISKIADVAAGRDVPAERFAEISDSARIASARVRRAATRATPHAARKRAPRARRTRRMVSA